ncbi:hypothetical protein MMC17_007881 [Xylographa soralifera]|nr:hypothetical protein [Xylographa soralifera]
MPTIDRLVLPESPKRKCASPAHSPLPSPSPSPESMAPTRQLYTTTTTVFVGPSHNQQTFTAHTLILTSSSRFFAAALSPSSIFSEADANSVSLPEACPRVFSFWLQWAYSRNLTHEEVDWDADLPSSPPMTPHRIIGGTSNESNTKSTAGKRPPRHVAFFHLIRLYKLAGFLGCEELRNAIIDKIARVAVKRNAVPGPDDTFELWGEEYEAGGLRELVLDLFVGMRTERLLMEAEDEWDERFMRELVVKEKGKEKGKVVGVPVVQPWQDECVRCWTYHEHMETRRCHPLLEQESMPLVVTKRQTPKRQGYWSVPCFSHQHHVITCCATRIVNTPPPTLFHASYSTTSKFFATMPLPQRTLSLLRSPLMSCTPTSLSSTRLVRFASVKVDQTKKDNNPTQPQEESHKAQASETDSDKIDKAHPAQQPDPQKEPSRTTGIEKEGAGGVTAGRGKE